MNSSLLITIFCSVILFGDCTLLESVDFPTVDEFVSLLNPSLNSNLTFRSKRDSYGYGGYGGGYGSYGGGGYGSSYSCPCSSNSCDNNSVLYLGLGALLGFLLSMMMSNSGMMMMMPTGREMSEDMEGPANMFINLLENSSFGKAFMPVIRKSRQQPKCTKRWLCEDLKEKITDLKWKGKLASITSFVTKWAANKFGFRFQLLQTMAKSLTTDFNCASLSPLCNGTFT